WVKLITSASPEITAVLTVYEDETAVTTFGHDGETLIEKSLGVGVGVTAGIMISCAAAECADVDPDPETVNGYVPGAAVPAFMFKIGRSSCRERVDVKERDAPAGSTLRCKLIGSGM